MVSPLSTTHRSSPPLHYSNSIPHFLSLFEINRYKKTNTHKNTKWKWQYTSKRPISQKMLKQNNRSKNLQNHQSFSFMLAVYCWAWSLLWNVTNILSGTLLEKSNIFCKWIPVAESFLVMSGCPCPSHPFSVGNPSGLNLCRSVCNDTNFMNSYVHQSCFLGKQFPWSYLSPLALTIFLPSLVCRTLMKLFYLSLIAPKLSFSAHFLNVGLCVSLHLL